MASGRVCMHLWVYDTECENCNHATLPLSHNWCVAIEFIQGRVLADYARISSRYEWIRYRALYSDLKFRTIYNFDAYIC